MTGTPRSAPNSASGRRRTAGSSANGSTPRAAGRRSGGPARAARARHGLRPPAWSASTASRPATPPPATSTRGALMSRDSRYGARWRPATLCEGHQVKPSAALEVGARRVLEVERLAAGEQHALERAARRAPASTSAPARPAMSAAATSACCAASPPCLSGRVVMSPTAQTSSAPRTRPKPSTGTKPCSSHGRPGMRGPLKRGSATTRSASTGPSSSSQTAPSPTSVANAAVRTRTPAAASRAATSRLAAAPKTPSGHVLARDDLHVERAPLRLRPAGGHQGELVQRQRPRDPGRRDEDDPPPGSAARERAQGVADRRDVARAREGERAGERRRRAGAERQQEHVVGHSGPPSRVSTSCSPGRTAVSSSGIQRTPRSAAIASHSWRTRRLGAERLGDRERAVGQEAPGGEHGDLDPVAREVLEREQRLERPDPAAGDQHARRATARRSPALRAARRSRRSHATGSRRPRGRPASRRATRSARRTAAPALTRVRGS